MQPYKSSIMPYKLFWDLEIPHSMQWDTSSFAHPFLPTLALLLNIMTWIWFGSGFHSMSSEEGPNQQ